MYVRCRNHCFYYIFAKSVMNTPTNKKHTFVCQKCVFCLSKPQAWHIIRRQAVYHQRRLAAFVYHHGVSRVYFFLRLDEIQFLVELMIYSPIGLMICKASP